jgi:predicted heme/steroid binding protein/rubrerythrin
MPFFNYPMMYNNQALQNSLKLIKEAVQDERNDELFYDYLISIAPSEDEKEIIVSIRNDERKHNKMFRKIYKDFTGMDIEAVNGEEFENPESYLEGIKKALFGELKAVEKYREIRQGLLGRIYRDMLFEIITDELKHSSKYNYLYTSNSNKRKDGSSKLNYTPDEWVIYITPLVKRALAEAKEGINMQHLFEEFILSGVLVGLGKTPQEAIEQVEQWEKTGESKLLAKSKMQRIYQNNPYRQQQEFTLEELSQYDGRDGKAAYTAVDGVVYDMSEVNAWKEGKHFGLTAGKDLTSEFKECHGKYEKLNKLPKVGILKEG